MQTELLVNGHCPLPAQVRNDRRVRRGAGDARGPLGVGLTLTLSLNQSPSLTLSLILTLPLPLTLALSQVVESASFSNRNAPNLMSAAGGCYHRAAILDADRPTV